MILQAQVIDHACDPPRVLSIENRECFTPEDAAVLRSDFERLAEWQDVRVVSVCGSEAVRVDIPAPRPRVNEL